MYFTGRIKMPRWVNPSAEAEDKPNRVLDSFIITIGDPIVNTQIDVK